MFRPMSLVFACVFGIAMVGCGQQSPSAKEKVADGKIADNGTSDWKTHNFPKGEFSVAMPPKSVGPKERQENSKIPQGNVETIMVSFVASDKTAFSVTSARFPAGALKNLNDEQRLTFMLDNAGKAMGAKLKDERIITLGAARGKAAEMDLGGAKAQLQVFVTKNRNYQILVLGPKDGAGATQGAKFFESFQIESK